MDLARAPRRTVRKKGSGYENGLRKAQEKCYLRYIKIRWSLKVTETLIFADDSSIFYSHPDPNHLESVMDEELKD
jgi:hypothetical protein